jgi:Retroviral aspartyl protease
LSTNTLYEHLEFQLCNHSFTSDLRVLQVTDHYLLLGMDWLYTYNPIEMNCRLGQLTVTDQYSKVQLVAYSSPATIHLCEQDLSIPKEIHQGNQLFIAHISCLETSSVYQQVMHPQVQQILDYFHEIFAKPTTLHPKPTQLENKALGKLFMRRHKMRCTYR